MRPEKMKVKYLKRVCERPLLVKVLTAIVQLHYELTSSQIIFSDFDWMNIFKMPEKHLWESFVV